MTPEQTVLAVPNISTADAGIVPPGRPPLDTHVDPDHVRSVLTYGGGPGSVRDACIALAARAVRSLDLTHHGGVHPRFGVLDVLPLIPYGTDEQTVLDLAAELEISIGNDLEVPVYRFGGADTERRTLPALRRALRDDPHPTHPTAGVVCLGIRDPLIAFNVDIRGPVKAAREIASTLRSDHVRALGFDLASRGVAQVSMNLIAPEHVGPKEAFDRVARLARESGVEVVDCEIVGLVPEPILPQLEGLPLIRPARSIEQALAEKGVP